MAMDSTRRRWPARALWGAGSWLLLAAALTALLVHHHGEVRAYQAAQARAIEPVLGTVTAVSPDQRGQPRQITVQLPDSTAVLRVQDPSQFRPGQSVTLRVDPADPTRPYPPPSDHRFDTPATTGWMPVVFALGLTLPLLLIALVRGLRWLRRPQPHPPGVRHWPTALLLTAIGALVGAFARSPYAAALGAAWFLTLWAATGASTARRRRTGPALTKRSTLPD